MPLADLYIADFNHGILGMEFAVAALKRLGHPLDGVHDLKTTHQVHIDLCGVAHKPEHRLIGTLRNMNIQPKIFQPVNQLIPAFLCHTRLHHNNHCCFLLFEKITPHRTNLCGVIEIGYCYVQLPQHKLALPQRSGKVIIVCKKNGLEHKRHS